MTAHRSGVNVGQIMGPDGHAVVPPGTPGRIISAHPVDAVSGLGERIRDAVRDVIASGRPLPSGWRTAQGQRDILERVGRNANPVTVNGTTVTIHTTGSNTTPGLGRMAAEQIVQEVGRRLERNRRRPFITDLGAVT